MVAGRQDACLHSPALGNPKSGDIYTLDIATRTLTRLTDLAGVEGDPKVSPDGRMIAYDQWPAEPGIYVMDFDGSNPRRVFALPDDTYVLVGWSADGTEIYLIQNGTTILRLNVSTGDISQVATGGDESLRLSPDGATFAFQGDGLFVMDVDGSNVRHVAGSWTDGGPITWSPDGSHLAFAHPDGWFYVVGADGSEMTRWTEGRTEIAWRPGS